MCDGQKQRITIIFLRFVGVLNATAVVTGHTSNADYGFNYGPWIIGTKVPSHVCLALREGLSFLLEFLELFIWR